MPFGSAVPCQVCPPLALDIITPPVSPALAPTPAGGAPSRAPTRFSRNPGPPPAIQHSSGVGQAKPAKTLPAGNPWASMVDQDSPPLSEATRWNPAPTPFVNDMAIQTPELRHERNASQPLSEGILAGDHLRPLSVL
jgi:hypothetical protein